MRSVPQRSPRRTAALIVTTCGCGLLAALASRRSEAHAVARPLSTDTMAAVVSLTAVERGAVVDRVRGALWGVYIADALSMPVRSPGLRVPHRRASDTPRQVHWIYDPRVLRQQFPGGITKYEPPKKELPGSIMAGTRTSRVGATRGRSPGRWRARAARRGARTQRGALARACGAVRCTPCWHSAVLKACACARSVQHGRPRPRRPERPHHRRRDQPREARVRRATTGLLGVQPVC